MELSETWTCGCGAVNTSDVFTGACWKCGVDWSTGPVKIETAEEVKMCPECRATDGFHKMNCSTMPDWAKAHCPNCKPSDSVHKVDCPKVNRCPK